jgi:hypothetical protein
VNIESPARAEPLDVSRLVLRYTDAAQLRVIAYGESPLASAAPSQDAFAATWIRGDGSGTMMEAGDLVEIHFNLAQEAHPRTAASLVLIPESAPNVDADFKTPATYSSDLVITLR